VPRYFFDTSDNGQRTTDGEGFVFEDRQAVRRAAVEALPHMALDTLPDGDRHEFVVEVRDEAGETVFRATLSLKSEWLDGSGGGG
jgi:hypothetical protein